MECETVLFSVLELQAYYVVVDEALGMKHIVS